MPTGFALLQAISFFASDVNCLFEGVYYGPLIWLISSLLIACTATSYLTLGPTVLSATLFYLLILPVEVILFFFFVFHVMLDVPQNSLGSGIWGTSEWKY